MKPTDAPINDKSSADDIANLQQALLFLGYNIEDTEVKDHKYGDSTNKVVLTFQEPNGLSEKDEFRKQST